MLEELDIGHKSLNAMDALSSLETAISNAKNNNLVALKVVHGSGSGTIRKAVRAWGVSACWAAGPLLRHRSTHEGLFQWQPKLVYSFFFAYHFPPN